MIIIAGLIIAFILLILFSRPDLRHCRWRRGREEGALVWRCAFCGAKVTDGSATPPKVCFKNKA
ncbi:hypothetical protein PGB28_02285 [Primorskyibacter aestuariivivens]|uniref:hypothetical protein n=1 Tax=Primorskyibacter aestuariivivens TaxID=1888912 RepID=UPI00230159A6|nr:hypothetical protein [Primorskyibacter aestuariivivens]MDA7427270.1 hypothetical protein [Primorskyibacter aestuariivivens]